MMSQFKTLAGVGVFINFLFLAMTVTSIVGCAISLSNALKEEKRRTEFIIFSSIGLGFGVFGLFYNPLGIVGYIFMVISLVQDEKLRSLFRYTFIPAIITLIITIVYVSWIDSMINQIEEQYDSYDYRYKQDVGSNIVEELDNLGRDW